MASRPQIAEVLSRLIAPGAPLALTAYDGSSAGSSDPLIRLRILDPKALNYMATAPGELGLARAYVTGTLDVEGDTYTALKILSGDAVGALSINERLKIIQEIGLRVLRPLPPPPEEVSPGLFWGLRHSLGRDSKAISHHYDVSNRFYEWILGPSMAYTCAVYPGPSASLEEAQEEKVDLVCRKLDLKAGQRLLDVGCGWGTMVRHAAEHYGVKALGVTLSAEQAAWGQKAIERSGLGELAEIRHMDYRHVTESGFDAVSSIGLTEHIGASNLSSYAAFLASRLKPRGRLLNHCITRPTTTAKIKRTGGFINRYVFPDGELEGVGRIISEIQNVGFEVRHEENLREHYAKTLEAWSANLDHHWDEAVAEVGVGKARVWKLYLAGSRLGFDERRIELHQVLATKTSNGDSGMPLRPDFTRTRAPLSLAGMARS